MSRFFKYSGCLWVVVLFLAACAQPGAAPSATPRSTDTPVPTLETVPQAVEAARQTLADRLGVEPGTVTMKNVSPVEWPDACLGLPGQDEMCAEVITPGYEVTLESGGQEYVYRTDSRGQQVRLFEPSAVQTENALLSWQSAGDPCESLQVLNEGILYGECAAILQEGSLSPLRLEQWAQLYQMYASFEARTPSGMVRFQGMGQQIAGPAEQRRIAEWARLAYQEASTGQSDPSTGLVLTWHREGGLAGFCDDLTIDAAGWAQASQCGGQQPADLGSAWLEAAQLGQLYDWMDRYETFELGQKDPAVADAMLVQLAFRGEGSHQPDEQVKSEMTAFAAGQHAAITIPSATKPAQVQRGPVSADLETARQTLFDFFAALNAGEYARAADLLGGDYEVLRGYNPEVPPEDYPALLEAACRYNGFQCSLQILQVERAGQISPDSYRFTVEFSQPDGEPFVLGPCCGASAEQMPPRSLFEYNVIREDGDFKVEGLPVYVP